MARLPSVKTKTIMLGGGLDLESPHIAIKEGFALEANNIEANLMGGYRKMLGYERLDGRPAPSDGVYYILYVDDSTLEAVGTAITGASSGATATITSRDDTINALGITALTGNFVDGELLNNATTIGTEELSNHPNVDTSVEWELAAQDWYRSFIQPLTGSGDVLGVWRFEGVNYAFRSNGTDVVMHKSSSTGWQVVPHFQLMEWGAGVLAEGDVVDGDTLTGLTSGASGTVKSFIKVEGSYALDATGYMVIDTLSGTFQSGEEIQKGAVTKFTSTSTADQIKFTLSAGNHDFRFITHNFKGAEAQKRMYGVDGVNRAFQFDGTVVTPIITGMAIDTPSAVESHKNHLFLAFNGGSLQHSATTEPLIFNPILGAAELTTGDNITGLKSVGGDALLIATDRVVHSLYGTSAADWNMSIVARDTGDVGNTLDVIGSPLMTTKRGIVRIDVSERFGNFESSTVSRRIRPLLDGLLNAYDVIGVNIIRDKNQYRIYFSNGFGIVLSHDALYGEGVLPQFTTFEYLDAPTCVSSNPEDQGEEVILFGSSDGYVYQEEKGYNFDGEVMNYSLRLPFHHLGTPALRKSFKWLSVEIDTTRTATLRLTYEFSDGQTHTSTSAQTEYNISIGAIARWNLVNWNEFLWDSAAVSSPKTSIKGTGYNISLFFFGVSAVDTDFTINSVTYQYLNRRLSRG